MKLKTMLWIGMLSFLMFSCDENNESNLLVTNVDLEVTVAISTVDNDSIPLKSDLKNDLYSFSGSGILCLGEYNEFHHYMSDIQKINPRMGSTLIIDGLADGNKVNTLQIKWSPVKEFVDKTLEPVDLSPLLKMHENGKLEIKMTSETDPFVECIGCEPGCMFKVEISGTSNFDISSTAILKIPIAVEQKVNDMRFSVF